MTGFQSNKSFTQAYNMPPSEVNNPVELCQRMVIKYLSNTLTRLMSNNQNLELGNLGQFVPNDDGDRAVWYLELLESQLGM